SLLLLLVGSAALIGVFHDQLGLLPLVIVAALVAEALYWVLQPTPLRPIRLRLFAFALPFAYYCIYLSALQLQYGIWWSVHMATGAVVLAGVVGLLLSLLMLPPTAPAPQVNPPS